MTWVSIITPVYNGVEFLEQCAMSVCLQNAGADLTWDWWIGINGHGTGGEVLEKARAIQKKCPNFDIHVINLPRAKGKVEALNALVAMTTGQWIAVLDCDDTWERNKLLYQKAAIDMSPTKIDVVGTFCKYFGDMVSDGPALPEGFIGSDSFWKGNPIINSSALIRRELARWEDRFGLDDYDMWLRLLASGAVFFNLPYQLVNHRIHTASAFNGKGKQDVSGLLKFHGL
jgi:glycosyltransferase involved in cell wall biosynthesis